MRFPSCGQGECEDSQRHLTDEIHTFVPSVMARSVGSDPDVDSNIQSRTGHIDPPLWPFRKAGLF